MAHRARGHFEEAQKLPPGCSSQTQKAARPGQVAERSVSSVMASVVTSFMQGGEDVRPWGQHGVSVSGTPCI